MTGSYADGWLELDRSLIGSPVTVGQSVFSAEFYIDNVEAVFDTIKIECSTGTIDILEIGDNVEEMIGGTDEDDLYGDIYNNGNELDVIVSDNAGGNIVRSLIKLKILEAVVNGETYTEFDYE